MSSLSGAMDDMLRASGKGPKRKPGRPRALTELGRGTFVTRDRDLVKATREAVEAIWGKAVLTNVRSARLAPRSRSKLYTLVWRIMVPKYPEK